MNAAEEIQAAIGELEADKELLADDGYQILCWAEFRVRDTIDAQLAILEDGALCFSPSHNKRTDLFRYALDLARAINGGTK